MRKQRIGRIHWFFCLAAAIVGLDTATALAQSGPDSTPAKFKLVAEGKALATSLAGTLVPIAGGLTLLVSADKSVAAALFEKIPDNEKKQYRAVYWGLGLIYGGLVLGPAFGYPSWDEPGTGQCPCEDPVFQNVQYRVGLLLLTGASAGLATLVEEKMSRTSKHSVAKTIAVLGTGLIAASAIDDIVSVKAAVRKHNRSLQEKALTITPAYFAQHGAPGVAVQVQF